MVNVKIEARATTDRYGRMHGMAIDEPLDAAFWTTQPEKKINVPHDAVYELRPGIHTIEYGNSGYCSHPTLGSLAWEAAIFVDEHEIASDSCLGRDKHLIAQFIIGPQGKVRPIPILRKSFFPKIKLLTRIKGLFKPFRMPRSD